MGIIIIHVNCLDQYLAHGKLLAIGSYFYISNSIITSSKNAQEQDNFNSSESLQKCLLLLNFIFLLCYFERQVVSPFPTSFHSFPFFLYSRKPEFLSHLYHSLARCPDSSHFATVSLICAMGLEVPALLLCRDMERTNGDDGCSQ